MANKHKIRYYRMNGVDVKWSDPVMLYSNPFINGYLFKYPIKIRE